MDRLKPSGQEPCIDGLQEPADAEAWSPPPHPAVRLLLTKKLAERIDGISLKEAEVGVVIYVSPAEARLLIAEGWAEPLPDEYPQSV